MRSLLETVQGYSRLAEHMILSLYVVQPTADSEERLASGQELLRLGYVDKANRIQ